MTKNIDSTTDISSEIKSILLLLKFPGSLHLDCQGFIEDPQKDIVFQYASQNSALPLQNGKNHIFLDTPVSLGETIRHFEKMSNQDIVDLWFETHNRISGLSTSGFQPMRLTSLVFFYEPTYFHIDKVFKQ